MIKVGRLKALLENIDNEVIILSSEEGCSYEIEDKDIDLKPFEWLSSENEMVLAI